MKRNFATIALTACIFAGPAPAEDRPGFAPMPEVKDDGTITTPSFELPFSSFASPEATKSFVNRLRAPRQLGGDLEQSRRATDEQLKPQLEAMEKLYPYTSTRSEMGGVPVDIFVPKAGIAPENEDRVLIELHGGGFVAGGGGPAGAIESIPVAGEGRIKVVAVDYRLAPEHRFPAASEDVEAVYRELLKTYRPENIGMFGCSAGGMLTGQSIAWFLEKKLPVPGAIGIFCASTHSFAEGDSAQLWSRMGSVLRVIPPPKMKDIFGPEMVYLAGVKVNNPLAVPGASRDVLKAFPPTLFLTGTRAPEMSGAAQGHLELRELGVKSELLLFDGMDHGFYSDPALPESVRAYKLIARFFAENLGSSSQGSTFR